MKTKKNVLVIGALGGLGSATVNHLAENGWYVFAADKQSEVLNVYGNSSNIKPLQMDITNEDSIVNAFQLISNQTDHLNALINMAGILKIGSLVELSVSELEEILDINLLGVYQVNKHFLPMLLPQRGRIIILSSEVGGQTAAPFNGLYTISKYALEAYSDSLRRELAFLGIKVIKVQPGPFKTQMTKNTLQMFIEAEQSTVYFKKNLGKGISYLPKVYENANDPILLAKLIMKVLESSTLVLSCLIMIPLALN